MTLGYVVILSKSWMQTRGLRNKTFDQIVMTSAKVAKKLKAYPLTKN